MFAKIVNLFNRINNHFTYRQRFVFFSFVFIVTTPFPGYWLLRVENFFINRSEWQLVGNRYQEVIGCLMYEVLHHRILIQPELQTPDLFETSSIGLVRNNIDLKFQKLERLNAETDFIVQPSLGKGFSEPPNQKLEIKEVEDLWIKTARLALAADTEAFNTAHIELMQKLQRMFEQLENTFQLNVAPTEVQHELIDSTIYLLPEAQWLITELLLLREKQIKNPDSKELLLESYILKQKLRNNLQETYRKLDHAYQNYKSALDTKETTLISAKQAYTDYYTSLEDFIQDLERIEYTPIAGANKALEASEATRNLNIDLTNALVLDQLSWFRIAKNSSLAIYIGVALTLTFYIAFRVLTRHLMEICYHLREMSKGNFKRCFCSHFNDEFGLIGRTFDRMGRSIQDVLGELMNVGSQLSESINQITKTAKTQEKNASHQEEQVQEIKKTASLIALESRNLANAMNELSQSSVEGAVADKAKEGLDRMQKKMEQLTHASTDIISNLTSLQERVKGSHTLIEFMGNVSDQASLLSLNSAIETANIGKHKASFAKITEEIQRFADKTKASTDDIEQIIREITISVSTVRKEAEGCLKEINEGAHRLINVSTQLSNITKQGKEQIKKFGNVNDVMQMQAIAAENIINSISNLSETAQENTRSIRLLHENIEELGKTAEELQKTVGLFV